MMNAYKCIVYDLDNTAVAEGAVSVESPRLKAAFAAVAGSMMCVAATGRTRAFAEPIIRQLNDRDDSIIANGAQIINIRRGEILRERQLSHKQVDSILRICKDLDYRFCLEGDAIGTNYAAREQHARRSVGAFLMDVPQAIATEVQQSVGEQVPDVHAYLSNAWTDGLENYDVNMSHQQATKGDALEWVLERHGIKRAEVIAVGDGMNDHELFAAAGYCIATSDAHHSLLELADEVIPSQAEAGLAILLEHLAGERRR